jgi:hypothetical protein
MVVFDKPNMETKVVEESLLDPSGRQGHFLAGLTSHGNFSPVLVPVQPPLYFTPNTRFTLA